MASILSTRTFSFSRDNKHTRNSQGAIFESIWEIENGRLTERDQRMWGFYNHCYCFYSEFPLFSKNINKDLHFCFCKQPLLFIWILVTYLKSIKNQILTIVEIRCNYFSVNGWKLFESNLVQTKLGVFVMIELTKNQQPF